MAKEFKSISFTIIYMMEFSKEGRKMDSSLSLSLKNSTRESLGKEFIMDLGNFVPSFQFIEDFSQQEWGMVKESSNLNQA